MTKKVKQINNNQRPKKLNHKKCEIKNVEIFCRKLQQLFDMLRNDGEILEAGDSDHTLYTNNKKQTLPERDTNEGPAYNNNYKCHRCKQLAEVTLNMFPSFDKRILSVIGNCEVELNFIQAVVWLKSVATYIPKISVEKLQQLFNEQGNISGKYSYNKNRHTENVRRVVVNDDSICNVESSKNNKAPSIHEMFNNSQVSVTSSLENILDFLRDDIPTPMNQSYIDSDDIQNGTFTSSPFALPLKDRSESVAELSKLETGTGCVLKNKKKEKNYLLKPYIIPDMQKHQISKHKKTLKNSNKQVNNEIIGDKSICFSQNADNISIVSLIKPFKSSFSSTYDNFEKYFTQMLSQYDDKMEILDNYVTNFPNYNINFSPISYLTPLKQNNVNNSQTDRVQSETLHNYNYDDFENFTNDFCTLMSDVEIKNHDNAYSTSENEAFNYDTAKTPKPINNINIKNHGPLLMHNKPEEATISPVLKPVYRRRLSAQKLSLSEKRNLMPANKCIPDINIKNHSPLLMHNESGEATISPVLKPVHRRRLSAPKLSSSEKRNLISAKDLSNREEENTEKTLSLENIFNSSYDISPINKYIDPDMQSKSSSFPPSLKDQNESIAELSKTGTSTGCVTQEKIKEHLSKPYVISDLDIDSLSELSKLLEELDDIQEHQTFEYEETSSENSQRINNEIIEDKNTCFTSKNAGADISNEHRSASPATTCQSIESVYQINDDSHCTLISETTSEDHDSAYSTLKIETLNYDDAIITESNSANKPDTKIGHCYNLRPRKEHKKETVSPSLIQKPIPTKVSPKKQSSSNKRKIESSKKQSSSKKSKVESPKKLPKNKKRKGDKVVISTNLNLKSTTTTDNNKRILDTDIKHYNLQQSKKQNEEETVSFSLIQKPIKTGRLSARKQSSTKKRKPEPAKDLSKKNKDKIKRENNKDEVLLPSWLDFDVKLLNAEHVILASVKVILSTVCDKRTAQIFSKYNVYWKDSLEELVVNAILNVVDIFKKEKKPDICRKQIEKSIIETLDEMMTSIQLNETSLWVHRIQIILQFCDLLPICVKTINYLIAILETLQKVLIDAVMDRTKRATQIEINQLHLTSYALDIALRKYRILVPKDSVLVPKDFPPGVKAIPYVGDLWKMRYIEKFEDETIDLDAAEKNWIHALKKFTTVSVNHFVQFVDVSLSLYQTLIFA